MTPQEQHNLALRFVRLVMLPPLLEQRRRRDDAELYGYYATYMSLAYLEPPPEDDMRFVVSGWDHTPEDTVRQLRRNIENSLSWYSGIPEVWRDLLLAWSKIPSMRPVPDEALVILDELLVDAGL